MLRCCSVQRMRNQLKAQERKAKKAAEGGEVPAKKKLGRKRAAPIVEESSEEGGETVSQHWPDKVAGTILGGGPARSA